MNKKNQFNYCTADGNFGQPAIVDGELKPKRINHFKRKNRPPSNQRSSVDRKTADENYSQLKANLSLPHIGRRNQPVNLDLTNTTQNRYQRKPPMGGVRGRSNLNIGVKQRKHP